MAGSFELSLRRFAQEAGEKADEAVRQVALEICNRVILRSPVDTGRFRSNWNFSIGAPDQTVTDKTTETTVNGLGDLKTAKAGDVLYIANNLPYAYLLEVRGAVYASNALGQIAAPAGIVGLTISEFSEIVDQAASEVNT